MKVSENNAQAPFQREHFLSELAEYQARSTMKDPALHLLRFKNKQMAPKGTATVGHPSGTAGYQQRPRWLQVPRDPLPRRLLLERTTGEE